MFKTLYSFLYDYYHNDENMIGLAVRMILPYSGKKVKIVKGLVLSGKIKAHENYNMVRYLDSRG